MFGYTCQFCGKRFERLVSPSSRDEQRCPLCGDLAKRDLPKVSISRFKGGHAMIFQADAFFALCDKSESIYASRNYVDSHTVFEFEHGSDMCSCGCKKDKRAKICDECKNAMWRERMIQVDAKKNRKLDGAKLRAILTEQGWTNSGFGIACGIAGNSTRTILRRGTCSAKTLKAICRVLNITPETIGATP